MREHMIWLVHKAVQVKKEIQEKKVIRVLQVIQVCALKLPASLGQWDPLDLWASQENQDLKGNVATVPGDHVDAKEYKGLVSLVLQVLQVFEAIEVILDEPLGVTSKKLKDLSGSDLTRLVNRL